MKLLKKDPLEYQHEILEYLKSLNFQNSNFENMILLLRVLLLKEGMNQALKLRAKLKFLLLNSLR